MLRRFALVLMLFIGLALVPLARAAQPCCEQGGCEQVMPACVAVCALCASPAALPGVEPRVPVAEGAPHRSRGAGRLL